MIPTWPTLRRLGANRAIRSANVWAFLVPIAAKLLDGLQDVVTIELLGHHFPIHLSLPFSWKLLFVAAIAFLLANIIFDAFCPPLIAQTSTYRDFSEQGRSGMELNELFSGLLRNNQIDADEAAQFTNWLNLRQAAISSPSLMAAPMTVEREARNFAEAYAAAVASLAKTKQPARVLAVLLYTCGLAAFALVIAQNIEYVALHW